jgi:hypothetical protein
MKKKAVQPERWSVPRLWSGATVAVLASGAGMTKHAADMIAIAGIPAIAINETWRMAPWAQMLYAADIEWWAHPDNTAKRDFVGLKVSCMPVGGGVHQLRNSGIEGFDEDPGAVRTGGNSGYQALHIAVHAGAARVLLCGFNLGGERWHGKHKAPLRDAEPEHYAKWGRRFDTLAPLLAERGVDVVNCTPGSALKCFRSADLRDELRRLGAADSASVIPPLQKSPAAT